MLETFDQDRLASVEPDELSAALEQGSIVYFPQSPVAIPAVEDLIFIRQELPRLLKLKNISYHPESGKIRGLDSEDREVVNRVTQILLSVSDDIASYLQQMMPRLTRDWTVGTCSFRPIEEQGRNLSAHASNELIHVDAGAYGATNGDRILRFFINVNPDSDRVWASKGAFPELCRRYAGQAGLKCAGNLPPSLVKGPLDHLFSGLVNLLAWGVPELKVLDSSPYDREMRKFHNFMKDTPAFQQDSAGHQEFRFPPFSAWMVFTDMVSHASLSGQFAFVHTSIVKLENCSLPQMAPINLMRQPMNTA